MAHIGEKLISQCADTNGDGTGTDNANGDYSGAAEVFKIAPAAGEVMHIHRAIISIVDSGAPDAGRYGNNITLTNGVRVFVVSDNDADLEITAFPILTNTDWASHCHDLTLHSWGTGDDSVSVRWTFSKSGRELILDGSLGMALEFRLNDDFTGLVSHRFLVQGYYDNIKYGNSNP